MQKLKIDFTDTWDACVQFFVQVLSNRYNVEISKDAEFLIFCDETFGNNNLHYSKKDIKKIFYTGENRRPENYSSHYAITFDHNNNPWHYRLPLYVMDMWAIEVFHGVKNKPYGYLFNAPKIDVEDKKEFCAFVHRNPNNIIRNNFFIKLNSLKKVNSAGAILNNTGITLPNVASKIEYFGKHKFSLCFENSSFPGYVTEKILHGFYGGTIPIYWGSTTICKDFNSNSFLNYSDFKSEDHLVEKIFSIDADDSLYNKMVNEPKFLYNIPNEFVIINNFLNWFDAIVFKGLNSR